MGLKAGATTCQPSKSPTLPSLHLLAEVDVLHDRLVAVARRVRLAVEELVHVVQQPRRLGEHAPDHHPAQLPSARAAPVQQLLRHAEVDHPAVEREVQRGEVVEQAEHPVVAQRRNGPVLLHRESL